MSVSTKVQTTSWKPLGSDWAKASSRVSPWGKEATPKRALNFSTAAGVRNKRPIWRLAPSRQRNIKRPAKAKLGKE
jgi:hypothetical protein